MIRGHPYALRYESFFSLIVCRRAVKKNYGFPPEKLDSRALGRDGARGHVSMYAAAAYPTVPPECTTYQPSQAP